MFGPMSKKACEKQAIHYSLTSVGVMKKVQLAIKFYKSKWNFATCHSDHFYFGDAARADYKYMYNDYMNLVEFSCS